MGEDVTMQEWYKTPKQNHRPSLSMYATNHYASKPRQLESKVTDDGMSCKAVRWAWSRELETVKLSQLFERATVTGYATCFPLSLFCAKVLGSADTTLSSMPPKMALPVTECPGDSTERNGNDVCRWNSCSHVWNDFWVRLYWIVLTGLTGSFSVRVDGCSCCHTWENRLNRSEYVFCWQGFKISHVHR